MREENNKREGKLVVESSREEQSRKRWREGDRLAEESREESRKGKSGEDWRRREMAVKYCLMPLRIRMRAISLINNVI